jgi:hypothetical protein
MIHLDEAANMSAEQLREEFRRLSDEVINFKPSQKTRQTRTYVNSSRGEEPTFTPRSREFGSKLKEKWLKYRQ